MVRGVYYPCSGPSSVPSTNVRWLMNTSNCSSRVSNALWLPWPLQAHSTLKLMKAHTHTNKIFKSLNFSAYNWLIFKNYLSLLSFPTQYAKKRWSHVWVLLPHCVMTVNSSNREKSPKLLMFKSSHDVILKKSKVRNYPQIFLNRPGTPSIQEA